MLKIIDRIDLALAEELGDPVIKTRNVGGTAYKGNVSSTAGKYDKALAGQNADPHKMVKEVQQAVVRGAKAFAKDPEALKSYLTLVKSTVNSDVLAIAKQLARHAEQQAEQQ
tara:strand:- start:1450 stop:1785 length:336 start_codon:yes stop_codon:yes gene_type:complete